ncbi:hypothetical protein SBOR_7435 [Sclerotinia borealis F-4128]|uniref:BTB domain-containing protein n=1 Tax=Sclerotinia borealis (strain F-4128) TaxID=1432307 RepID=W9C8Q1_SCLBF|nr:hypothetical protein SBOR_7435 [Sclerotinia borealis F-4128]
MDDGLFAFEHDDHDDDDAYETSDDDNYYSDETESQAWQKRNRKQMIISDEQVFENLPADQFLSKIDISSGPTVKIFVRSLGSSKLQALTLPKDLLCSHSPFFDHAFNCQTQSHDAVSQEMSLPEISLITFQLIVQFLCTNTFVFPTTITSPHEKLTLYLLFFQSCARFTISLTLTSPHHHHPHPHHPHHHPPTPQIHNPILTHFKQHLQHSSTHGIFPHQSHMQLAITLPTIHEARRLAIAACVKPYAYSLTKSSTCYGRALFHLEGYVQESTEFAAELMRAYTKAVRGALGNHTFVDPLMMRVVEVRTGGDERGGRGVAWSA